jgi:cyclic beta-1,2-glucan synthetase
MAEMSERLGRPDLRRTYQQDRKCADPAGERAAWDGEWYLRATFDDGTPLGSSANKKRGSIPCRNPGPG